MSGLQEAITAITAELGPIAKADVAPDSMGGYKFRGIETIMAQLGSLLAKHSVIIIPHVSLLSVSPSPGMPNGWQDSTIEVLWDIIGHDECFQAQTIGVGRDKSDKGVTKAQTQAYKYLLLPLFSIADALADADGIPTEAHVDVPEVLIISKTAQDGLLARIAELSDEHKEKMVEWFKEKEVPPIKRLPDERLDDVEAILSHYENLEDAEAQERAET